MDNTNLRRCTGCKGNRPLEMFVANQETYNACQRCRNRQSDVGKPIAEELLCTMDKAMEMIPSRDDDDDHVTYTLNVYIRLDDDINLFCGSRINGLIDKRNANIHLNIEHSIGHIARPPIEIYNVDDEIRLHIEENSITMSATTLYQDILTRYPEQALGVLTQPQVFTQVTNQYSGLGFVMPLFRTILQSSQMGEVEEFHVDSTFKTNRTGHELFRIVATVNGVGAPFAYFLLKMTTTTTPLNDALLVTRSDVIAFFFTELNEMGLHTRFMFTDKDEGQVDAITRVWGDTANERRCENANDREAIAAMMKRHYNMHANIPVEGVGSMSNDWIYEYCVEEVYDFCKHSGEFSKKLSRQQLPTKIEFTYEKSGRIPPSQPNRRRRSQQRPENPNTEELYRLSLEDWTCGCPSFFESRFMLCKYLLSRYRAHRNQPLCETFNAHDYYIYRNSLPPYIQLKDKNEYPFSLITLPREVFALARSSTSRPRLPTTPATH
ncbi:hypothetical protein BDA99DRAFT_561255 [Phascolomyces articulosus]|uniref:SWIM-type domain-containing protein n=1 Tax=Phascolomyces articulosus TaxID=60185 RepID=A0AAD5JXI4_9FUNG|nr:hypothetical protein BDA99DRAFT_561255 [Phascolomyces articulosus]